MRLEKEFVQRMMNIKNVGIREFKLQLINGERLRSLSHKICKSPAFQNLKIILFTDL